MQAISFFSFKGGVGRTNLLLNIAYGLARGGDFVVIADWDLHAPGLTTMDRLFRPVPDDAPKDFPRDKDIRKGVLDYLETFLQPDAIPLDPATMAQPTRLGDAARRDELFTGDVWFIPAGQFDPSDTQQGFHQQLLAVQSRNLGGWFADYRRSEASEKKSPVGVAIRFKEQVGLVEHPKLRDNHEPSKPRRPDYLLLDSRTGMTEIGDLVLGAGLADRMVLVTGLNDQNMAGLEAAVRDLQTHIEIGQLRSRLIVVASPVPQGEEVIKRERLQRLSDLLGALARRQEDELTEPIPEVHRIPYHPLIALTEDLVLEKYPESDPAQAMLKILNEVQGQPWAVVEAEGAAKSQEALTKVGLRATVPEQQVRYPKIELHPWSQLPVWNWPDPAIRIKDFLPGVTEQSSEILNGLARSVSLSKDEVLRILDTLGGMTHFQLDTLENNLKGEQERLGEVRKEDWESLLKTGARSVMNWLEIWCKRTPSPKEGLLEALTRGHRDAALGVWAKTGYFWFALAELLRDQELGEDAEWCYRRAIKLDRDYSPARTELGILLRKLLKRYDKAEDTFREAIRLDETYAPHYLGLGMLFAGSMGRVQEGKANVLKAKDLDPNNPLVWHNLGYIYGDLLGDRTRAKDAYRKAIELDPNLTLARFNDAEIALLEGDERRARTHLDAVQGVLKNDLDRRHLWMMRLALSLRDRDLPRAAEAHGKLQEVNGRLKNPTLWTYESFEPFISGLPAPAQRLLRSWVAAVKHEAGADPEVALKSYLQTPAG